MDGLCYTSTLLYAVHVYMTSIKHLTRSYYRLTSYTDMRLLPIPQGNRWQGHSLPTEGASSNCRCDE